MSLQILKNGVLDTIQDLGRPGFSKWGVNPGGAMDRYASQIASALVGNDPTDPVIEIHFPSGEFRFLDDALIAITGANFKASVNGISIPQRKPIWVRKNSVLSFLGKINGQRAYLAVSGKISIPSWLGSGSTNLKVGAGGFEGRALRKNDTIIVRPISLSNNLTQDVQVLPWSANMHDFYENPGEIRFVTGNEWDYLTEESKKSFNDSTFGVKPSSDRMSCHLEHELLNYAKREELISSAVSFGTVQGLPNGNALILMADHQTTGGYPRLAHVITADLGKLSQLAPGEHFRFKQTTIHDAEKALISLEQQVRMITESCHKRLKDFHASH